MRQKVALDAGRERRGMHRFRVNFAVANIFKRILESQNLAKNEKRFAKMRRRKYARPAFTMLALTMIAGAVHFQTPVRRPSVCAGPEGSNSPYAHKWHHLIQHNPRLVVATNPSVIFNHTDKVKRLFGDNGAFACMRPRYLAQYRCREPINPSEPQKKRKVQQPHRSSESSC